MAEVQTGKFSNGTRFNVSPVNYEPHKGNVSLTLSRTGYRVGGLLTQSDLKEFIAVLQTYMIEEEKSNG